MNTLISRFLRPLAAAIILAAATTTGARADLPAPIAAALAEQRIPASKVSLVVRTLDDRGRGATLLRHNAATARNPASVIKLLTTLAALETLGPDYRWETAYLADGAIRNGTLHGDLILRGGGDPFITVEDFLGHLLALRQTGLRRINGDLVIDNSRFAPAHHDPAAFDRQPTRSYNTAPDAALINLSATRFVVEPRGGRITARAEPPLAGLRIDNRIKALGGTCKGKGGNWSYRIARDDSARGADRRQSGARISLRPIRVRLQGAYRAQCGEDELIRSIVPNAEYTCRLFTALWREMGGKSGGCRLGAAPPRARRLLAREGAPLADIITGINKFSNNVMTRQLLLTLAAPRVDADGDGEPDAAQPASRPATSAAGVAAIRAWLAKSGLAMPSLVMDNGAGLSRTSRASAAGLSRLLAHAWRGSYRPEFLSSLPLAATDGTMRKRLSESALRGRARIKTGLIDNIRSMAGYVHARDGRHYAVAMMIDSRRVNFWSGNAVQDAVLEWVFAR